MDESCLELGQRLSDALQQTLEAAKTSSVGSCEAGIRIEDVTSGEAVDFPLAVDAHAVSLRSPLIPTSARPAEAPDTIGTEPRLANKSKGRR